jgi:hypothetical protein
MRYEIILQDNEQDWGSACLTTVAKQDGRTLAINVSDSMLVTANFKTGWLCNFL